MGLVKTRRLAAMHSPSRDALRRTWKQTTYAKASTYAKATVDRTVVRQRAKFGTPPPVKKGAWKGNGSFPLLNGSSSRGPK